MEYIEINPVKLRYIKIQISRYKSNSSVSFFKLYAGGVGTSKSPLGGEYRQIIEFIRRNKHINA